MTPTKSRKNKLACATLALSALAGCSGEVLVSAAAGASGGAGVTSGVGGSSSSSSGGEGGQCAPEPWAGLPSIALRNPTSGVFVGGRLHLTVGVADQPAHYLVLQIAGGVGYVVNQPGDMDGPANLAVVDATTSARVNGASGVLAAELIDVSDPEKPFKKSSVPLDGTVPAGFWKVFSVVDNHLFTCLTSPPGTDPAVLVDVPLDGLSPPAPVVQEYPWEHLCSGFDMPQESGAARGSVWLDWAPDGYLKIFDVTPQGAHKQGEYNYNIDGVHHYGDVLGAATDGERIVFDPENDSEVFLYTPGSTPDYITHAHFGIAGPKQLLGVVNKVSYWATAKGVRAYDITDLDAPKLLDFHADADFGEGLAVLIADSADQLAVADADGRLFVIPLGQSGPVEPLKTYLGAPGSASAGPCSAP
jgi:hypothetical protein